MSLSRDVLRAPRLDDVAESAGVSRATASRVIRGEGRVSPGAVEAVREAVARLGYRPNEAARALVTRSVGVVAVLVAESDVRVFADPFFSATYHGVLSAFAGQETHVVLSMIKPGRAADDLAAYLGSGRIDGAVVVSHHGTGLPELVAKLKQPTVFVGDPGIPGLPYVDLDQGHASRLATERLLARGATRLATITGPLEMASAQQRFAGFRDTLAEHKLRPAAAAVGDYTFESGETAMEELLAGGKKFDGLFVASDLMASGALRALSLAGIAVPDDLPIVSFDDSPVAPQTQPPLTTVDGRAFDLAERAGLLLGAALRGEEIQQRVILRGRLVERASA